MGHNDDHRYIEAYDKYMRQEYDPNDFANNEKMFVEEYRNPENYHPQTPNDNRTDNRVRSSLTQEEMDKLGIRRIDGESEEKPSDKCSKDD